MGRHEYTAPPAPTGGAVSRHTLTTKLKGISVHDMSTPTSTLNELIESTRFDQMVAQFTANKITYETTPMGSARGNRAERVMETLVARAERGGFLAEFVATVTK